MWQNWVVSTTYHHGNLELSLVTQAVRDVERDGVAELSLRNVASQVGVSPSAAYHHFSDKQALLNAVGDYAVEQLGQKLQSVSEAIPRNSDENAVERLSSLFFAYLEFAEAHPNLYLHAFGPMCDKPERPDARAYEVLEAALDELEERNLLRVGIRQGLDSLIWAHVHGVAQLIVCGHLPRELIEAQKDLMERLILSAR